MLLVLTGAYNIRHHYYLNGLDRYESFTVSSYQEPRFPKLTQSQILNLGWAHVDRKILKGPLSIYSPPQSSYINFSESKSPNTIRIGLFGGSYVWGEEAAYAFDFPTLLQELFDQVGHDHVQVLNFGVPGYGVHQIFLMWEYVGKQYDLDYSIFFPFSFHIFRDVTFNLFPHSFCPIHARYIVSEVGLTLSPVLGNSRKEACSIYHRLLTPWQYILHDRRAPAFLRVLVPKGREFKLNPFYYTSMDKTEETLTTYTMLFNRLAAEAKHPIVVCDHPDICGLQNKTSDDIYFYESEIAQKYLKPLPSLYHAPKGHLSALGNEMRAQELFSFLTAQKSGELQVLTLTSRPDVENVRFDSSPPISHYDQMRVGIQGYIAADFVSPTNEDALAERFEKTLDFKKDAVASLLWVTSRKGLEFIPVSFPLERGQSVFARFEVGNDRFRIPIGRIEATNSTIGRLRLNCSQWATPTDPQHTWRLKCKENSLRTLRVEGSGELQAVQIEVGENANPIMKGERINGLQKLKNTIKNTLNMKLRLTIPLEPLISSVTNLRATSGSLTLRESQILDVGTLDLMVQKKNEQPQTFPLVPYRVVEVTPPHSHLKYPYPIQ